MPDFARWLPYLKTTCFIIVILVNANITSYVVCHIVVFVLLVISVILVIMFISASSMVCKIPNVAIYAISSVRSFKHLEDDMGHCLGSLCIQPLPSEREITIIRHHVI